MLQRNPDYFYREVLGVKFWHKQEEIIRAIENNDKIAIRSCRGSGKTWTLAQVVCRYLSCFPETVIVTTAPSFTQVEMLLWREIRAANKASKIPLGGTLLNTRWDMSETCYAIGISVREPENIQGYHGKKNVIIIIDEASGISEEIYESIEGIMSGGNAKLIMIGNPTRITGAFANAFKDPGYTKIHISAMDSPNVQAKEIVFPGITTYSWVESMRLKYGEDSDVYRVHVLGDFPKGNEKAIVSIDDVEQAINREQVQKGLMKITFDVARYGSDYTACVVRQGEKVIEAVKWHGLSTIEVFNKVKEYNEKYKTAKRVIGIDEGNMGAGVVDLCNDSGIEVFPIVFSAAPINDEDGIYLNLRAQMYSRFKDGIKTLDLPKNDDWYLACAIEYTHNAKGKLQIQSKEDIKKKGSPSPDLIDALVMTYYPFEEMYQTKFDIKSDFSMM